MTTTLAQVLRMRAHGLHNCWRATRAAKTVGIPLPVACALLNMESMGMNIYGHDFGGAMSAPAGREIRVTRKNWLTFRHLVLDLGHTSNGVGPCQITWSGWFPDMAKKGLRPWRALDNMVEGFGILKSHFAASHSWQNAAQTYNGTGPAAVKYGEDFMVKLAMWEHVLA